MVEKFEINPKSRAEQILESRNAPPEVTVPMYKAVSDYRKNVLADEVDAGVYREGSSHINKKYGGNGRTQAGVVAHSGNGLYKQADAFTGSSLTQAGPTTAGIIGAGGSSWRGAGGTVRQVPEVYSPLWLNSNLNLPRDRATVLAWCRSFFALNPIVQNSLTLHSTYPISKLSIKCRNEKVEKFFAGMIEEIDLMNICVQIAQEYWTLGEAFVYAELDDRTAKWSRLLLQNPDYITVKRSAIAGEPIISMRPDENLRRIVTGNRPSDIEQRRQLDPAIIEHVRRGENIPLNNFYVTHLARRISPYEIRGTGLPVSVFRQLMLFDCLRECYSSDTEVLTRDGFKNIKEIIKITDDVNVNSNYINGAIVIDNNVNVLTLKDNVEIACYNQKNGEMEYHKPEEMHMSQYNGKMLHFDGEKVDCLVTPNHKMLVKEKHWKHGWGNYELRRASELLEKKKWYKFKCNAKWTGKHLDTVNICGKDVETDLYLKLLGYIISEGCIYKNYENGRYDATVILSQATASDCYNDMRNTLDAFAKVFDKNSCHRVEIEASSYSAHKPQEIWDGRIHGKDFVNYLLAEIGNGETAKSHFKRIPRWVLELDIPHLKVLLNSLVKGDGSEVISKFGTGSVGFKYSTVSKQLSDDVYELVFKCGFTPNICISEAEKDGRHVKEYIVLWSTTEYGKEPNIYTGNQRNTNNGGGATVEEVDYNDVVWCFTVPTGSFITRRNHKISIHGNSKYAQAHNLVNPLTLVKIGNEEFKPTPTDLDAWRDVFECHDEETEVLTDQGFKKFDEVIEYAEVMDGTYNHSHISYAAPKSGFKVACFNPDNEQLEYHEPSAAHVYNYNGEMVEFKGKNLDVCVTPNHEMLVRKRIMTAGKFDEKWSKIKAGDINSNVHNRFRSVAVWDGRQDINNINILGQNIPIELYLKFLGYLISEGSIEKRKYDYTSVACLSFTQSLKSDCIDDIKQTVNKFANYFDKDVKNRITTPKYEYKSDVDKSDSWEGRIYNLELVNYFIKEIGSELGYHFDGKIIPTWVLELDVKLLKVLLNVLVAGDGGEQKNKKSIGYKYYTSNYNLAQQIQELVFKCGYSSNIIERDRTDSYIKRINPKSKEYIISWSTSNQGSYPLVYKNIKRKQYNGKVWCFTVPTGLFVTRRNGKITIQGNSAQYDKDFKIFTHNAVTVERVGAATGIYDISGDITQLIKEIYIGLMVPAVLMDGQDTTYANGSVALDVLRQRYMQFRNMMGSFLKRKIFAPIAKLNDFYEYIDGEKVLMVPDVDWNHMSLFDMADYIGNLTNLSQSGPDKKVSLQTLYRSLGLDYTEERRKMRYEDINDAIRTRELAILSQLPLNKLRSLSADDEIKELVQSPLPGETPYEEAAAAGTGMDDGGMGGMGMPSPAPTGAGLGGMSMPTPKPPSAPVGRPSSGLPQPPGGGVGIGPAGVPKPTPPSK